LKPYSEDQQDAEILRNHVAPANELAMPDVLNGWYGYFLNEGDFEHYQKFCYMKDCPEKRREKLRALWILQRFNLFGSEEWSRMTTIINPLFQLVKNETKAIGGHW